VSVNLVRYDTESGPAWGAVRGDVVLPLPADCVATADVLADGAKLGRTLMTEGDPGGDRQRLHELRPLTPVTAVNSDLWTLLSGTATVSWSGPVPPSTARRRPARTASTSTTLRSKSPTRRGCEDPRSWLQVTHMPATGPR
jgi:hypothetical protein